jgi:hypothetical protein
MIQVWLCRGCVERTSGSWEWNVETQDQTKCPTCSGKWWWDKEDGKHTAHYYLYESLLCMRKVIGHAVNKPDHPTECRTVNQVNDTVCHGCHGDLPFGNTRKSYGMSLLDLPGTLFPRQSFWWISVVLQAV